MSVHCPPCYGPGCDACEAVAEFESLTVTETFVPSDPDLTGDRKAVLRTFPARGEAPRVYTVDLVSQGRVVGGFTVDLLFFAEEGIGEWLGNYEEEK